MSCGCGKRKKRVRPQSKNHRLVLAQLHSGMCKVSVRKPSEKGSKDIYCTLHPDILPNKESSLHRETYRENMKNPDSLLVWTLNKNSDEDIEKRAGWIKIKTDQIVNFEYAGKIKL